MSEGLLNGEAANITRVLTEEASHAIDAKISRTDSPGDEGNIFARLMSGETLSQEQLAGLRAENDSAVLSVAGESVTVEAAGMSDAALQSRIENLSDEDRTFFEGVKNGIVDTGMDIVNAAQLAYKLTTDPNERAKFAASVGKITDALAHEETRSEAIKLIGSELGGGLLEAFNNFGNDPDYYVGYLAGSVAAGGAISKLAKFSAVATKLDKIVDTLKRVDIHTEGFGSNGGNIRVGLKPKFDKVTAENLDEVIKEFGHNAGKNSPVFEKWLNKGGMIEILPDSSVKYSIDLNGTSTTVVYENGFPDFTPHLTHPSGVKSVTVNSTIPDNYHDYKAANKKAGREEEWGSRPPEGYRWHHHEDLTTMQLVPKQIHLLFSHTGGASLKKAQGN